MNTQGYILDLLARGCTAADAAKLAQVSEGYVSQLTNNEDFIAQLNAKRAAYIADRDDRANKVQEIHDDYLRVEQQTLRTLERDMPVLKPIERIKLLSILAAKKEPAPLLQDGPSQRGTVNVSAPVQVVLPQRIAAQFVLNAQKEIIGMENGQVFAPLSTQALKQLAQDQEKQEQQKEQKAIAPAQNQIPKSDDLLGLFGTPIAQAVEIPR